MPRLRIPASDRDHVRGPAGAPITLIEYGDFQCRYCRNAVPVLTALEDRYRHELRFIFRHFPLTQLHPLAMAAAEAAEAAGAQGHFWDMHAMLFQHQPEFLPRQLIAYASDLALDVEAFAEDLASHRHAEHIHADFMGGVRSGVNGTPSIFINGERFDGAADETRLARAIDAARLQPRDAVSTT